MNFSSLLVFRRPLFLAGMLACLLQSTVFIRPGHCQTPDAFIKIRNVDQIIHLMDRSIVGMSAKNRSSSSPGAMIRGLLQGTDWIDSSRAIVIGVTFANMKPEIFFFIPFAKPNEKFRTTYNAVKGSDFYVIPLSSGRQQVQVRASMQTALKQTSQSQADALISIKVEVKQLMTGRYVQIKQFINGLRLMQGSQSSTEMMLKPEEMRVTLLNLLAKAQELEHITGTIDFDDQMFHTALKMRAIQGSAMAQLFGSGRQYAFLSAYHPEAHIHFRSRAFDVQGVIRLLDACFGRFYQQLGVDFKNILTISAYFTGETAGGVSYDGNRMQVEMISQLNGQHASENFISTHYLPWLLEYNRNLSQMLQSQFTGRFKSMCSRTLDSTVDGYKVFGIKGHWPVLDAANNFTWMQYRTRITTVGDFLIIAPSDNRMKALIQLVKSVKRKSAGETPLMATTVDLNGYLAAMKRLNQNASNLGPMPRAMGAVKIILNCSDQEALFASSMRVQDIRNLTAFFSTLPNSTQQRPRLKPVPAQLKKSLAKPPRVSIGSEHHEAVRPQTVDFWLKKGLTCAAYGNNSAAVKHFKKALALSPQRGDIWFNQGIAYGEMGDYVEAIMALNKALELDFPEGRGLYGRGRVYLLAGEKSKALEDFHHAAALGYKDAINYLDKRGID